MPDTLYLGDRGSGKTTALVLRFCALLEGGADPGDIQVLSGQRFSHSQRFKQLLFEHRPQAIGGLRIDTPYHLARRILQRTLPSGAQLLNSTDTLLLLKQHYQMHGARFFPDHRPSPGFFEHLLRRHQRCAANRLWDDALHTRSQQLENDPLAFQANHFLKHFSDSLQQLNPPLYDALAQAQHLSHRLIAEDKHLAAFRADYWLIDNLEETRPLEQMLFEVLSAQAKQRVACANPYGGLDRSLGAYPEYVKAFETQADTVHTLERARPLQSLAQHMYWHLQHIPNLSPPSVPVSDLSQQPEQHRHTGKMYEAMAAHIQQQLNAGTPPHDIACITWYLDPLSMRHLQAHFEAQGIPVDILQGRSVLQRSPLVNTLLSLLRLVFWPYFQHLPDIPRLSSLDMTQIFRLCGGLDAFEVSDLRFRFGDRLDAWGQYLQHSEQARLQSLQTCIQSLRERYPTPSLGDIEKATHTLWQTQLLPFVDLESPHQAQDFHAVHQLLQRLYRQCELASSLSTESADFIWPQIFEQRLPAYTPLPSRHNQRVKVMTVHRLCEQGESYAYQHWFDLSNPNWFRPLSHPIDNALVLSQSWPLERPITLHDEDLHIEERLAACWRKGLLYCDREARFYAALYDSQARMQRQENLIEALRVA